MRKLERTLGLPGLSFFGVGMILGAGIYSVVGAAAGKAGPALWLSFLLGGVAALFTGLSYAELATMYPRAGAEFVYVGKAFPRAGWAPLACGIVIVVAACATATTVSLAFAGYLAELAALPRVPVALGVLAAVTAVNVVGLKGSTAVTVAFTLVETAGLVLVIALGASHEDFGRALAAAPSGGVLAGAALVFFAYLGFEQLVNLAEESRRPERDLPRAILVSLAVTTVLYVLVALAVVALAEPSSLAESDSPLARAVGGTWPRAASALAAVALFATSNTALATMLTASRMLYGMARDGELPEVLASVMPSRATPWVASLAVLGIACALVPLGGLALVAGLSSFGALLAFLVVNVSVVVLRLRAPGHRRPFRVPLAAGRVPVLPVLGVACALALLVSFDRDVHLVGIAALGGATALALGLRLLARRRRA